MFRISIFLPFVFVILALCLIGCSKNEEGPPDIIVLSPSELQTFIAGDSIPVKADISHSSEIVSVKVSLLNSSYITVVQPGYFYPGSSSFSLDIFFETDMALPSGVYNLLISASGKTNTRNTYVKLVISGEEMMFERMLAVCNQSNLKTVVYEFDNEGNYQKIIDFIYPCIDSDISSFYRQLYMIKPEPSVLFAYNLDELSIDYTYSAIPPYPEFFDVDCNVFLSTVIATANGDIISLNQAGGQIMKTSPNADTVPKLVHRNFSRYISYCERRSGPQHFIRQYWDTGILRADLMIDLDVLQMYGIDADRLVIFGNNDGEANIYTYWIDDVFLDPKIEIPGGKISCVVQISGADFLVGHDLGIYRYEYASGSVTEWIPGMNADAMAYDYIRDLVVVADGNDVYFYTAADASPAGAASLPYPVLQLHVQNNK